MRQNRKLIRWWRKTKLYQSLQHMVKKQTNKKLSFRLNIPFKNKLHLTRQKKSICLLQRKCNPEQLLLKGLESNYENINPNKYDTSGKVIFKTRRIIRYIKRHFRQDITILNLYEPNNVD